MDRYSGLRHGLVGAWCPSLGATGDTLLDRSGRNQHGTLTNMAGQDNWRASGNGLSLNFDGSNDYVVKTSPSYSVAFPFSISVWFNISSAYRSASLGRTYLVQATAYGGASAIMSIATDYSTSTDKLYYFEANTVKLTTETFTVGAWQHAVMCFDSTTIVRFFLNGRQGTIQQPSSSFSGLGAAGFFVGGLDGTAINCPALVDDIRFFRRPLTASDVSLLASQRGIGLVPQRQRGAFPRKLSINVGGTWRPADAYLNVGGAWKLTLPSVNVGGTWK